jgi:hypothetical protein
MKVIKIVKSLPILKIPYKNDAETTLYLTALKTQSTKTLIKLSKINLYAIRLGLTLNPKTPTNLLREIFEQYKNEKLSLFIALHHNVDRNLLLDIYNFSQTLPKTDDYYCILKANVFKNQQCPTILFNDILNISLVELFDENLNKPNWYFVARAISNPNCPENVLRFIFNNDIFKIYSKAFLLNEKCPQDIISNIKKTN